jgi:hypothetical protein
MLRRLLAFMVLAAAGFGSLIASDHFRINGQYNPILVLIGIGLLFMALFTIGWPRGRG